MGWQAERVVCGREKCDYSFDNAPGKVSYFYHDPERCWKYIRPVKKV